MNTTKPNDWREYRRFQAYELKQQGWKNSQIAQALSVSKGAVSQWFKRVEQADGNKEVLRHHPSPGDAEPPSKSDPATRHPPLPGTV